MAITHIGIIPDGNRRYGKKQGLSLLAAYEEGMEKVEDVLRWGHEMGVKFMTLWAFSTENFNRNPAEKKIFFSLLENRIKKMIKEGEKSKIKAKIKIIGRIDLFPKNISKLFKILEKKTENYTDIQLNIAVGYGGRQEIIDACNKALSANGGSKMTPELLSSCLYTDGIPDPELIIRTSGETRLSGFMPWQTVYSEIAFLAPMWPELKKSDFVNAVKNFEKSERRFGK